MKKFFTNLIVVVMALGLVAAPVAAFAEPSQGEVSSEQSTRSAAKYDAGDIDEALSVSTTALRASGFNIISDLSVTDSEGKPLEGGITKWYSFRINGTFAIPNNQVHEGDTSTLTLPDALLFSSSVGFDLQTQSGDVVAHAVVDQEKKTITFTYTDYVDKHSDISGSFHFYTRVDSTVVTEPETLSLLFDEEGTPVESGSVDYLGVGEQNKTPLFKTEWQDNDDPQLIWYRLSVNLGTETEFPNAVVTDNLKSPGLHVVDGSVSISKGNWFWNSSLGTYELLNSVDVTESLVIDYSEGGFSVELGDIPADTGYKILYQVRPDYEPVDGEVFYNNASLSADDKEDTDVEHSFIYVDAGGVAEGYNFTIGIHKENEDGDPLAGAEFSIVRDRSNQVVGIISTDSAGNNELQGLLRDFYTIKEIKAPEGYLMSGDEIKITPSDFGSDMAVMKTVINQRLSPDPISIDLRASKVLTGKDLLADAFQFVLHDADGNILQTKTNDAGGEVVFDPITYDTAGDYRYAISEVKGSEAGMVYDAHVIDAVVSITESGGVLHADVAYSGEQAFINHFIPPTPTPEIERIPKTGDTPMPMVCLAVVAAVSLGTMLLIKRRRKIYPYRRS